MSVTSCGGGGFVVVVMIVDFMDGSSNHPSSDMISLYLCTTMDSGSRSGYPDSGFSVNIAVVVVRLSVVIYSSRSFRGIPSVPEKVDISAALYLLSVPLEWQTSYSYIYSNVGI